MGHPPFRSLQLSASGVAPVQLIEVEPISFSGHYLKGQEITISLPGVDGFTGWAGDVNGLDNPLLITMDSDFSITATGDLRIVRLNQYAKTFSAFGGSGVLEVDSNTDWVATTDSTWVETAQNAMGTGNGWFGITVKPNQTTSERQATVSVNNQILSITQEAGPIQISRTATGGSSDFKTGVHEVVIADQPAVIVVGENYNPSTPTYLAYYLHGDGGGHDWYTKPWTKKFQLMNEKGWVYVAPLAPSVNENYFPWHSHINRESNIRQVEQVLDFMFSNFNVYRETILGSGASGGSWFHDILFFPNEEYPSHFILTCGGAGMGMHWGHYSEVSELVIGNSISAVWFAKKNRHGISDRKFNFSRLVCKKESPRNSSDRKFNFSRLVCKKESPRNSGLAR